MEDTEDLPQRHEVHGASQRVSVEFCVLRASVLKWYPAMENKKTAAYVENNRQQFFEIAMLDTYEISV